MDPVLFIAAVALKSSAVLLLAALVALAFARGSAALRHRVWTLAVLGLLALPIVQAFAPPLRVVGLGDTAGGGLASFVAGASSTRGLTAPASDRATRPERGGSNTTDAALPPASASAAPPVNSRPASATWPVTAGTAILWLWTLGAIAVLGFFAAGRGALARLAHASRPLDDPEWRALADDVARSLGLRRSFRLLVTDKTIAPMTWGTLRPVLLLPQSAAAWPPAQRRAFLVHELAHLARYDCAIQQAAQVACALYWFHPLAWFAASRLRIERERACDDHVLADGASASAYATQLLEAVRNGRGTHGLIALSSAAMAAPSKLHDRVQALLDARIDRRSVALRSAVAGSALTFVLVAFLAVLAPRAPRAAETGPVAAPVSGGPTAGVLAGATIAADVPAGHAVHPANGGQDLAARFEKAVGEGRDRSDKAFWIAYAIAPGATVTEDEKLISDSEGWNPDDLERRGKSLATRFGYELDDAVFLFRIPAKDASGKPEFDRIAIRTASLAPDLSGLDVVSLGRLPADESLSCLDRTLHATDDDKRARVLVTAISLHNTPRTLVSLQSILGGERSGVVRSQSAEGLARHPVQRSLDLLVEHAKDDRSQQVRLESAEAIGDLDLPQATEELIDLAFELEEEAVRAEAVESLGAKDPGRVIATLMIVSEKDPSEHVRREAVETLGDLPGDEGRMALKRIANRSKDPQIRSEAMETLEELGQKK